MEGLSANAHAEASVAKFENNNLTANFEFNPSLSIGMIRANDNKNKNPLLFKFISNVKQTLNPAKYEQQLSDSRAIRDASVISSYQQYREIMPWMDEVQAFLVACGYSCSPEQANNISETFRKAENYKYEKEQPISAETRDLIIEGTKNAYDEDVQNMWAKLIAGEISKPGTFSRKTINALSEFDSNDAHRIQQFASFSCSLTTKDRIDVPVVFDDLPEYAKNTDSYKHLVDNQLREDMTDLRIIETTSWKGFSLTPTETAKITFGNETIIVINKTNYEQTCVPCHYRITKLGNEIITLCKKDSPNEELKSHIEFVLNQWNLSAYTI